MKSLQPVLYFTVFAIVSTITMTITAQAPARVSGVLVELNKPGSIEVALSVGAEDGARVGDKLTVLHDGQVFGTVEIVKTQASHSTAKIIDVAAGKTLSKNDEVRSR